MDILIKNGHKYFLKYKNKKGEISSKIITIVSVDNYTKDFRGIIDGENQIKSFLYLGVLQIKEVKFKPIGESELLYLEKLKAYVLLIKNKYTELEKLYSNITNILKFGHNISIKDYNSFLKDNLYLIEKYNLHITKLDK